MPDKLLCGRDYVKQNKDEQHVIQHTVSSSNLYKALHPAQNDGEKEANNGNNICAGL